MSEKKGYVLLNILLDDSLRTSTGIKYKKQVGKRGNAAFKIDYKAPLKIDKCSTDLALEAKIKEGINKTRASGYQRLLIDSNGYLEVFREDIFVDYLKLLAQAGIDFEIEGLDHLDRDSVGMFIEFLEQKNRLGNQLLEAARKQNHTSGKKKNKAGIKALTSQYNIDHNRLKKKQIADLDPNNILARKAIAALKKNGYTDYRIAKELNEQGIFTSKGSLFQPNTVKRQYDAYQQQLKAFKPNKAYEKKYADERVLLNDHTYPPVPASSGTEPLPIPLHFNHEQAFQDELTIAFFERIEADIIFQVKNNREETIFTTTLPEGTEEKVFNILNDTPLRPGRYYGILRDTELDNPFYQEQMITFFVRKDVI
jgi:hypothetical protein